MQLRCYQQTVHIVVWKSRISRQSVDSIGCAISVTSADGFRRVFPREIHAKTKRAAIVFRAQNRARKNESCTSVHTRFPQMLIEAYVWTDGDLARCRHLSTSAIHSNDNDLWKTSLLRFESGLSRLPSLPLATSPHQCTSVHRSQLHPSLASHVSNHASRSLRYASRTARRRA